MVIIQVNKTYKQFIGLLGIVILSFSCFSSCKVEPEEKRIFLLKNQSGQDITLNLFFRNQYKENEIIKIPNHQEMDDDANIHVRYITTLSDPPSFIDSVQVRYADGVTKSFQPYSANPSQPTKFNVMDFGAYTHEHLRAEVYRYTFTFTPEMYQYCKTNGYYTSE